MHQTVIKDFDLVFVDAEMTGRGLEHELIEIAAIRANSFDFGIIDEWEIKIKPLRIENADQESLRVCGYSEEAWRDAAEPSAAMAIFLEKANGAMLAGHALNNDWFYIMRTLAEHNLAPTFFFKYIDTFSLAWMKLRHDPAIRLISLKELARYYGILQARPHSALDDARTAYRIFKKLVNE